jgi:2-polyprenyl-3-methyl-5-hydroxy-6-metoxy-1,4-benzoquinol methylase
MLARLKKLRSRAGRVRADSYEFSDTFTGKFRSRKAALRAHADYPHDTDAEGQFDPGFRTYVRVEDTIEKVPPNTRVLDIGCNSGGLGRRLMAEKGCQMYGVDISPKLVERAREKGYEAYAGPAEDLRYEDGFFDVVVVSELLEHVHDPRPILEQAARVLKPGGMVLGDVPTEQGKWGHETIDDHEFHARVFTRESLRDLLAEYFRVEYVDGAPREGEPHPVYDVPTWYVFQAFKEAA